jgi:3-oxoacyl-[acyl-carrier protein] reductase
MLLDMGVAGKAVLVTGGSRGLGREIALAFAREGAKVAICARNEEQLRSTAREITALGVDANTIVADLDRANECERVVAETVRVFGRLDILVNNASSNVTYPGSLEAASDELVMERVNGKALTAIRCSRAALPHLRKSGAGRIVCIGGMGARATTRRPGTMSSSSMTAGIGNAAIVNFAKNLADEVARDGIVVNVIHPGAMRTERFPERLRVFAQTTGVTEAEAEAILADRIPIGRIVDPKDVAPLVVFLSSRLTGAVTGQTIAVDGGDSTLIVY